MISKHLTCRVITPCIKWSGPIFFGTRIENEQMSPKGGHFPKLRTRGKHASMGTRKINNFESCKPLLSVHISFQNTPFSIAHTYTMYDCMMCKQVFCNATACTIYHPKGKQAFSHQGMRKSK